MEETRIGLPNTCTACGNDPGYTWWAEHKDAALSGKGYCLDCALEIAPSVVNLLVEEALSEPVTAVADNLTKIKGIGAKRAAMLNEIGIHTFWQLALAEAEELAQVLEISAQTAQDWIETAGAWA